MSQAPGLGLLARSVLGRESPLALVYLRVVDAPPPFQEGVAAGVGDSALLFLLEDSPLPVSLQLHNHCWGVRIFPPTQSGPRRIRPPLPCPLQSRASCAFLSTSGRTLDAKAPTPAPAPGPQQASRETPGARVGRVCVCRVGDVAPRISLRVWPAVLRDDCRAQVRGTGAGVPPCRLSRR